MKPAFLSMLRRVVFWSAAALCAALPLAASAHRPALVETEPIALGAAFDASLATPIADPTTASQAVYGALGEPDQVDLYVFTAAQDQEIPVEVLVPVRPSLAEFRPWTAVWGTDLAGARVSAETDSRQPLALPTGMPALVIPGVGTDSPRPVFFEPFSMENLYRGLEEKVIVRAGGTYYVAVYDPAHRTGAYSLGIGTAEDFAGINMVALLASVFGIKLGIHAGVTVPWLDVLGAFLMMAGFIIGLGAVTVIDIHGFLGRKSAYWTEATTRTHKVTKPMIWAGIALAIAGGFVLYRDIGFSGTAPLHTLLAALLILNGLFLSFSVSPYMLQREREGRQAELLPASWQRKVAASLVVSDVGWWGALFLLAWHLIVLR